MHSFQQFRKAVVVIDYISSKDVVVVVGWGGEISLQVLTPSQGCHLRRVAGAALGVPQKVEGQIRCNVW